VIWNRKSRGFQRNALNSSYLTKGSSTLHRNVARRLRLKCDGTRAETKFRPSAKGTNPFKLAGASVQSTTGSRDVRISGSNAGYTTFRSSVKGNGYPFHSPVSPSLPNPCVTVCHHISTGLYLLIINTPHLDGNKRNNYRDGN